MRISYRRSLLIAATSCLLARADDVSKGVPLPGLRSSPPSRFTVSSAVVALRASSVKVTLHATGQRKASKSSLFLQLPRFGWLGDAEPYPDRHFPELQISVAGSPAAIENSFSAFVGSVDITPAIRQSGLDPFLIADTPPLIRLKPARQDTLKSLQNLHAISKLEDENLANWTAERRVTFPVEPGPLIIQMIYKARPAFALRSSAEIARDPSLAQYCVSPHELWIALDRPAPGDMFVVNQYAIPTSIDQHPARSLTLSLNLPAEVGHARPIAVLCAPNRRPVLLSATATGQDPSVVVSARPDTSGTVHILSIAR